MALRRCGTGRPCSRGAPHGVTLVELLVTIAIIGMLAGLLLPALSAAREAARRSTCMHNLSQIAKAVVAYDTDKVRLPGWRDTVDDYTKVQAAVDARRPDACVSWAVKILPFIDQREIFDWYETYAGSGGVDSVAKKRLPIYVCPSSSFDGQNRSPLSYAANGGTGAEVVRPESEGQFAQYVGDAAFVELADAGHTAAGDDNDAFSAAVVDFVAQA